MRQEERIRRFVEEVWRWYAHHKRTLPWRDLKIAEDTQRAYMILVSEVMLQQTQVPRVQIIFKQFIERFPTIHALAKASNREVLIAWRGMGYNSRALRLRDAAQTIVARCSLIRCANEKIKNKKQKASNGPTSQPATKMEFPRSMEELLQIPGIGPYTAAAIRNFAFGIPTPCVDVNIERILARVFGMKEKKGIEEKAGKVLQIALEPPPPNPLPRLRERGKHPTAVATYPSSPQGGGERGGGKTAQWHSALMDFGSAVCTKRKPKCAECPLSQGICRSAFKIDRVTSQPVTSQREPGRFVGGRYIPNRMFRGKVVDLLRDHPRGLTLRRIGWEVCMDWEEGEYEQWLRDILEKLAMEGILGHSAEKYILTE